MDSSVSAKDEIWFLPVCHHVSNALYKRGVYGRKINKLKKKKGNTGRIKTNMKVKEI
jgi:hypothetical protein